MGASYFTDTRCFFFYSYNSPRNPSEDSNLTIPISNMQNLWSKEVTEHAQGHCLSIQ